MRFDREAFKPYLGLLVIAGLLYLFISFVWPLMVPFFLALALAVLIDGPVEALEKRRIPRSVAILVILGGLLVLVTLVVLFGLGTLAAELTHLSGSLPTAWESVVATTRELQLLLESYSERLPANAADYITEQQEALLAWLLTSVRQLLDLVRRWALEGIPSGAVTVMITTVATFLMSRDKRGILAFLPRLVPPRWRSQVVAATGMFIGSAIGFINALVILLIITTVLTAIGLRLLGSPYAIVLGVLAGILDLIPVLGPGLIFVPWAFYHGVFGDATYALWLALLYGVLTVTRSSLEPRIIGSRTGVHPLSTLIALYVGLRLFGMAGFIIGPLVAILLQSLVRVGLFALGGEEDTEKPLG